VFEVFTRFSFVAVSEVSTLKFEVKPIWENT
jgi:hypothetical protein